MVGQQRVLASIFSNSEMCYFTPGLKTTFTVTETDQIQKVLTTFGAQCLKHLHINPGLLGYVHVT